MNVQQKLQAAQQRINSSTLREALDTLRFIVERLRIPHTRYIKYPGAVHACWNPATTKIPLKVVVSLMEKIGFTRATPSYGNRQPSLREFTNGTYNVLVGMDFGIVALRPVSKEPLTASSVTADSDESYEFDEYDDYDQWLADVKKHWPKARHNKRGLPGYKPGYGEPEDEEFVIGPDMQADVVAVWVAKDGFGWLMRNPQSEE